jgi:hypothetical protein
MKLSSTTTMRSSGRNRSYHNMTELLRRERVPAAKCVCITCNISLAVYMHPIVMQELESLASYSLWHPVEYRGVTPRREINTGSRLSRNDTTHSMIRTRFRIDIKLLALQLSYL